MEVSLSQGQLYTGKMTIGIHCMLLAFQGLVYWSSERSGLVSWYNGEIKMAVDNLID